MRPSTLASHRARIGKVATYLAAHLDDLLDAGLLAGHTPQAYRRLAQATMQPQSRTQLWQRIGAGGLRWYTEQRSLKAEG